MAFSPLNHILLIKAVKYKPKISITGPASFYYDFKTGAWLHMETNEFYANSKDKNPPRTKKADIETGEDLKGE